MAADAFWKQPAVLDDYARNGDKGKVWRAANAIEMAAALAGKGDTADASASELKARKEWLDKNFWQAPAVMDDFLQNGDKGARWKARTAGDATPVSAEEQKERKAWYAANKPAANDFWKDAAVVQEYADSGANAKQWRALTALDAAAAAGGKADFRTAPEAELADRKKWLDEHFWQAPKAAEDFALNGVNGTKWKAVAVGDVTPASVDELARRKAWFQANPAAAAAWWTTPEILEDYVQNGDGGKAWKAANATEGLAALAGKGDVAQASPEEVAQRKEWLDRNFWKAPTCAQDWLAKGDKGTAWKADAAEAAKLGLAADAKRQAPAEELRQRIQWFEDNAKPGEWWEHENLRKDFNTHHRNAAFWKNPEVVEDFLKNGEKGRRWTARTAPDAAAAAEGKADVERADEQELEVRRKWLQENFWQAPEYVEDYLRNGDGGAKWNKTLPDGAGAKAPEPALRERVAHYKPHARWQKAAAPAETDLNAADMNAAEQEERRKWLAENWWKSPDVQADFEKNGMYGKVFGAKSREAAELGLGDQAGYRASPEELAERAAYFEACGGEKEWWQQPAVVDDWAQHGRSGRVWTAATAADGADGNGAANPASAAELAQREEWMKKNFWKGTDAVDDFVANAGQGQRWQRKSHNPEAVAGGDAVEASHEELNRRRKWLQQHAPASEEEVSKRKEWLDRQLTDEEKVFRRGWMAKQLEDAKRIHVDELAEVLTALNDGQRPTPEQVKAVEDAVRRRRAEAGEPETDTITQEEFVAAVADTNFYVPTTDDEQLRAEQEALEAMQLEEMNRLEEEAGFVAMEAEEELSAAGQTYEDVQAAQAQDDEEAAYLAQMEEEQANAAGENEDDANVDDAAYQQFLDDQEQEVPELSEAELAELQRQEEERLAAEQAAAAALEEQWQSEELGVEDGTGDAAPTLDDAQKEELEAVIEEDPAEQWEGEEQTTEQDEIDEMGAEEKGQPLQWKLPLPEVVNPQYLKSYFTVIKYTDSHSLLGGKQKRVWVVDHFTRCFYNLDNSGKIKKEHSANKLLQLERNIMDPTRLRLMFFDSSHSYELQFFSPVERERFFESAQAIRPSIRVYAPDLTNQDVAVEACTTTIDGVGKNTVVVMSPNATGKPVKRELTGECKVNASKLLTEPLTVWVGTFNLTGHAPPRSSAELANWMPKDKYDVYAVAVQEASYRREEGEWFEYVQRHLGKDYLSLASMNLWDTLLVVLARKKHLLKITCVEGSTKATVHKSVCGTKGGIGISMRYLETSMAFVTCHLAARLERTALRNANVEEIVDGLQLGIHDTDFVSQFNHVFFFGDFNYRVEMDGKAAMAAIDKQDWAPVLEKDQLTVQRQAEGIMHGFEEPPITFAPTYRYQAGKAGTLMVEKGNAPSYCDRIFTRSMSNTWIKCTGYKPAPQIGVSEHQPLYASFIMRCVRPTMSCFMKQQTPIPVFAFDVLSVADSKCPVMKKPQLIVMSPFTARAPNLDAKAGGTTAPTFDGRQALRLLSVTQAQEYLETCHFIVILRDAAEKRVDKALRGTAIIPLFGKVLGFEGVPQDIDAELLCHGRLVGRLVGKFQWVASA